MACISHRIGAFESKMQKSKSNQLPPPQLKLRARRKTMILAIQNSN